jgi:hypothetical protein
MIRDQNQNTSYPSHYDFAVDMSAFTIQHPGQPYGPAGTGSGDLSARNQVRTASLYWLRPILRSREGACMGIRTVSTDTLIGHYSKKTTRPRRKDVGYSLKVECLLKASYAGSVHASMISLDMPYALCCIISMLLTLFMSSGWI